MFKRLWYWSLYIMLFRESIQNNQLFWDHIGYHSFNFWFKILDYFSIFSHCHNVEDILCLEVLNFCYSFFKICKFDFFPQNSMLTNIIVNFCQIICFYFFIIVFQFITPLIKNLKQSLISNWFCFIRNFLKFN